MYKFPNKMIYQVPFNGDFARNKFLPHTEFQIVLPALFSSCQGTAVHTEISMSQIKHFAQASSQYSGGPEVEVMETTTVYIALRLYTPCRRRSTTSLTALPYHDHLVKK